MHFFRCRICRLLSQQVISSVCQRQRSIFSVNSRNIAPSFTVGFLCSAVGANRKMHIGMQSDLVATYKFQLRTISRFGHRLIDCRQRDFTIAVRHNKFDFLLGQVNRAAIYCIQGLTLGGNLPFLKLFGCIGFGIGIGVKRSGRDLHIIVILTDNINRQVFAKVNTIDGNVALAGPTANRHTICVTGCICGRRCKRTAFNSRALARAGRVESALKCTIRNLTGHFVVGTCLNTLFKYTSGD